MSTSIYCVCASEIVHTTGKSAHTTVSPCVDNCHTARKEMPIKYLCGYRYTGRKTEFGDDILTELVRTSDGHHVMLRSVDLH